MQNDTNIHHQYRKEEINALTALNIHTLLAGHWHNQRNFTATSGSFTLDLRMAPAVAYAIGTRPGGVHRSLHLFHGSSYQQLWFPAAAVNDA